MLKWVSISELKEYRGAKLGGVIIPVRSLINYSIPIWLDYKWFPVLSPSKSLFYEVQRLKKDGLWNYESFVNIYTPRFNEQLEGSKEKEALNKLYLLGRKEEKFLVACYCKDQTICHLSIIFRKLLEVQEERRVLLMDNASKVKTEIANEKLNKFLKGEVYF